MLVPVLEPWLEAWVLDAVAKLVEHGPPITQPEDSSIGVCAYCGVSEGRTEHKQECPWGRLAFLQAVILKAQGTP